jgi:hypothetical protein
VQFRGEPGALLAKNLVSPLYQLDENRRGDKRCVLCNQACFKDPTGLRAGRSDFDRNLEFDGSR